MTLLLHNAMALSIGIVCAVGTAHLGFQPAFLAFVIATAGVRLMLGLATRRLTRR